MVAVSQMPEFCQSLPCLECDNLSHPRFMTDSLYWDLIITGGSRMKAGAKILTWIKYSLSIFMLCMPTWSHAHGFAGKRFFPTTPAVEDPFVSDEFSLSFQHVKAPDEEGGGDARTTAYAMEYAKRITPKWAISIDGAYLRQDLIPGEANWGFSNVGTGLKYQFFTSEAHEALMSLGVDVEWANSGTSRIGAESFSVISPAFFFGKGFGDISNPESALRALATTGVISVNIPSQVKIVDGPDTTLNPVTLGYDFTFQYNLDYKQSYVRDSGLGEPFRHLIPVVELSLETCMNRGCDGETQAWAFPGVLWNNHAIELGLSAQVPLNDTTGNDVGVIGLIHVFVDDLFPNTLGRPLFGQARGG
ncbi:MAG: hypothetical protein D6698_03535 [Gammaproteobacteria bacterium]|nr:MAG: hypothetical protein D6698_03535 [Gammaproteobacteria bacterium]